MDFALLPPEVNSARMYAGPGSGPMLAASAAWDGLAADLESTAASYQSGNLRADQRTVAGAVVGVDGGGRHALCDLDEHGRDAGSAVGCPSQDGRRLPTRQRSR